MSLSPEFGFGRFEVAVLEAGLGAVRLDDSVKEECAAIIDRAGEW